VLGTYSLIFRDKIKSLNQRSYCNCRSFLNFCKIPWKWQISRLGL